MTVYHTHIIFTHRKQYLSAYLATLPYNDRRLSNYYQFNARMSSDFTSYLPITYLHIIPGESIKTPGV